MAVVDLAQGKLGAKKMNDQCASQMDANSKLLFLDSSLYTVPEAFVEVTVRSNELHCSLVGRCRRALCRKAMEENYRNITSFGGFSVHSSDLLSRLNHLNRGEEAWVPDLQSSDESADEGPVKPTLKRWPKGGMWWDRYRSPREYPSSESTLSADEQGSEAEEEKPQHGSHKQTILCGNLVDISKGNGSNSLKEKEACRNGSQLKKPPRSQQGKLKVNLANVNDITKEKAVGEEQQNACLHCNKAFKSKQSLSNHLRIHFKENTYECSSCGKTFTAKKKLIEHLRSHEEKNICKSPSSSTKHQNNPSEKMPYKCLECNMRFMEKDLLLVHQTDHGAKRPHICPECGTAFIQKAHLDRHLKTHQRRKMDKPPEDEKEAKVEESPETPEKEASADPVCEATVLPESPTKAQEDETDLYKCQFCGRSLRSKSLLVDHERIHKEKKAYPCTHCNKSFHFKHVLLLHETIHKRPAAGYKKRGRSHPSSGSKMLQTPENPSKDSIDGKTATHSNEVVPHSRRNMPRLLYQCQYCGKSLSTIVTLADHEKLHIEERPYKCHECAESFVRKYNLIRHQEIHSKQETLKPNKYLRRLRMKSHRVEHYTSLGRGITHNVQLFRDPKTFLEGRYYKCQHCRKYFKTKTSLVNHKIIHKRKTSYQCVECKKSFSQKQHLFSHQKKHAKKKLSVCSDSMQKISKKCLHTSLKHGKSCRKKLACSCRRERNLNCNDALSRHESGHSDHRCVFCGKGFFHMWNLKRHEMIHLKKDVLSITGENNVLQDSEEEKIKPQEVFGERSKIGTLEDSGQGERHVQVQAKLSRTLHNHVLHSHREAIIPVKKVVKPEMKLSRQNIAILPYRQDKHYIHQQFQPKKHSKKKHLQTCQKEKICVDLQLRSQALPPRKSKREKHLPSWWARFGFCQQEEITPRKKSPKAKVCKNVKDCSTPKNNSNATVPSTLLKNTTNSWKQEKSCFSLSHHRTFSRESKMETSKRIVQGSSVYLEQQKGLQDVLERKQGDPQRCKPDVCEPQSLSLLPESSVPQNCEGIKPIEALQNTVSQNQEKLSTRQQPEVQLMPSEAVGNLTPQSHREQRNCFEPLRTKLFEVQNGAPEREMATWHQSEETLAKHACSQCTKSFWSEINLLIHEKTHKGNNKPFTCSRCEKSFYAIHSLYVHMRVHTVEKPFKCSKCDFRCNVSSNLRRHKETHVREKPFPCLQCEESFWFSHSLFAHLKIHSVKEPYKCPECKQMFSRKNKLKQHRKSKHYSGSISACSDTS
nr:zinc finger protein 569-like [Anolis sagrei ordinatus]